MALERRQFIGLGNEQALEFTGIDREITVNTSKPTLRVHTSLVPHGVNLATEGDVSQVSSKASQALATANEASTKADSATSATTELTTRLDSDEVTIQNMQGDLTSLAGRITQAEYDIIGKQATLVSGSNIKTINNLSILGSGNLDIQGGSSNRTKVIRQVIQISDITWSTTGLYPDYGASYYGSATISNAQIESGKVYFPIVLFDELDCKSNARLKSQCSFTTTAAGTGQLIIYSDADLQPNLAFFFNLILIEITNDSGDSSSVASYNCKGLTNANNSPKIVQVNSLPASTSANTIYLIPES